MLEVGEPEQQEAGRGEGRKQGSGRPKRDKAAPFPNRALDYVYYIIGGVRRVAKKKNPIAGEIVERDRADPVSIPGSQEALPGATRNTRRG